MKNSYWKRKSVFITGATGLLGAWLTKELVEKGAYVTIFMRDWVPHSNIVLLSLLREVNVVHGQLEDYLTLERALNEYEIDTCFHLGAQTIVGTANRSPLSTFESNIKGTWNILEAARSSSLVSRIVVASSDKAYGSQKEMPYTEEMELHGLYPYDVSKACSDRIAFSFFHTYQLPVAITRCGNFYGGGDMNFNRIVPGTIRSLIYDESPIIRSDGNFLRDYIYIEDAVDAYLTLAEALDREEIRGEAFNFGTGKPVRVIDLVQKILDISGKRHLETIILGEGENEIKEQYLSCIKAKKILGWESQYPLEKGLQKTIEWYKTFFGETMTRHKSFK
ncbi:MAG: GDP-mannose 4,6-dehydratase [Thermodesulfobacteriota bacterium]|nr:GDP-mannose 4,6-dehydratase [Thermodesulfobacteriota bacterium]